MQPNDPQSTLAPEQPAAQPPITEQPAAAPVTSDMPATSQPTMYASDEQRQTPMVTINMGGEDGDDLNISSEKSRTNSNEPVSWQAKEYIAPEKNMIWYACLGIVTVGVTLLDIFVMHSYTVTLLVIVIAILLVVMSVRPARIINYKLTDEGMYVGEQLYSFEDYKAFGVVHDGKENSVLLIPIRRFRPGLSVYFPVESGEDIVDMLGERLPMQEIHLDFVDFIVRMLRL